jgi:protein TonB
MHFLPRLTTSLMLALLATLSLFYLMNFLIKSEQVPIETIPSIIIELVKPLEMKDVEIPTSTPIPPPQPATEPQRPSIAFQEGTNIPIYTGIDTPFVPDEDPTIGGFTDGGYLPLVRVAPAYPRSAISRGVEGYTIVEFDISAEGTVKNSRILVAYPTSIFNASSLKAIQKFKYKPYVENGVAKPVFGVRKKFTYQLAEA